MSTVPTAGYNAAAPPRRGPLSGFSGKAANSLARFAVSNDTDRRKRFAISVVLCASMTKKQTTKKKTTATFEVRFVAADLEPEKIPLRSVSYALSAVQDLASGRDPYEMQHVPPEKVIGLVDVQKGSAIYSCVSRAPHEALDNFGSVATILAGSDNEDDCGDRVVAILRPIQSLSEVAKSLGCRVEIARTGRVKPIFSVEENDYRRISKSLLLTGETTITGRVERVGGVTGLRCMLDVPGRHRRLYCNVLGRDLARRLGQHLYEEIVATGTAVWIHRSWRIHEFTIRNFTQPRLGNSDEAINELRDAGLSAWDEIDDPEKYIRELRS